MATAEEANLIRNGRLGLLFSICLQTLNPFRFKFWASVMGVEMWKEGCTLQIFHAMKFFGIAQSKDAARSNVDRICVFFDQKIRLWQHQIEVTLVNNGPAIIDDLHVSQCYTLTWDNVQWQGHSHHQGGDGKNTFHLRCLAFAAQNRTASLHLNDSATMEALDLPVESFIPVDVDWSNMRNRILIIIKRILKDHIAFIDVPVVRHVPHRYSKEMSRVSQLVTLGTIDANPSSHDGVTKIMEHLQQYSPKSGYSLHPILCNGDGLSIDRMRSAKQRRCRTPRASTRLEGLVASPQEFHAEILLLQDLMNRFYSKESLAVPLTLYQIREYFDHRRVEGKVLENYPHVRDLLKLTVRGLLLLLVKKLLDLDNLEQSPPNYPSDSVKQEEWLQHLAVSVLDRIWRQPPREDFTMVQQGYQQTHCHADDVYPYCFCREEIEDDMAQCCNSRCNNGCYIHFSCANPQLQQQPEDDWFCSPECQESNGYIYCICHTRNGNEDSDMLQCELGDKCHRHQWYHPSCLGVEDEDDLPDRWFCSHQCSQGQESDDQILEHNLELLFKGLCYEARHDMVREGDGEGLVSMWKIDMVQYWNLGHTHYKMIGHQFLAGVAGFETERIRHELRWERLCNTRGVPGGNMGLDLKNEHFNNSFKEMIKKSRGQYTPKQIERCSKMSGAFGNDIGRLIGSTLNNEKEQFQGSQEFDSHYKEDVHRFVEIYARHRPFDYHQNRQVPGLGGTFFHKVQIKSPFMLGKYLRVRSSKMDKVRSVARETERRQRLAREEYN